MNYIIRLIITASVMCFALMGRFSAADIGTETASSVQAISPNFTLSGEISQSKARDLVLELERFRTSLLEVYDIAPTTTDQVVDIYIISDPEMFQVLTLDEEFIAIYSSSIVGPRVLVNGNTLKNDPDLLRHSLRHEYVHHFSSLYRKMVMPKWMEEGSAEYYAGYREEPGGNYSFGTSTRSKDYVLTYPVKGWFPLGRLVQSLGTIGRAGPDSRKIPFDWAGDHPSEVALFYSQSWAFVHYMMNQPDGPARLDTLNERVITLSSGGDKGPEAATYEEYKANYSSLDDEVDKALTAAVGESGTTFPATLQAYTANENRPLQTYTPKSPRIDPAITVQDLSSAKAMALQYRLLSTIARRTTINSKMKDVKAEMEADPTLATSLLISDAAQQSVMGANALGLENLRKALAIDPGAKDAKMLLIQMQFQEMMNQYYLHGDKMRDSLRGVLAENPNNPKLLVIMAVTGQRDGENLPAEVQDALATIESAEIIRRYPEIAVTLVDLYVANKDYAKALYVARRGSAFVPFSNRARFSLTRIIRELETTLEEEESAQD